MTEVDSILGPSRLWWHDGRGIARQDGVQVELRERPRVLAQIRELEDLEYAPGVSMYYLQERTSARRDLERHEIAECREYLRQMADHVRTWGGLR